METPKRTFPSLGRVLFISLIFLVATVDQSIAQGSFGRVEDTESNVDSYYYFVTPGVASIQVYVFGKMRSPGVYIVQNGSTLGLLLALTGGPIEPNQADVAQTENIQLYRTSGGTRTLIYESSFDEAIAEPRNSPVLQEGDIISVEVKQKRRLNWRDVFTVIGPILSTLLLIERLTNSNS